jgi:hypothetical protein
MPAFQFVAKGCELKYKGDTVTLIDQENNPVLCGKEFMDCTTFTVNPSVSGLTSLIACRLICNLLLCFAFRLARTSQQSP